LSDNYPGRHAKVVDILRGVGHGQIAASGMLARVGSVGGARAYPVEISIPDDYNRTELRLGMAGTATVFADNAGASGVDLCMDRHTAYL
jgi:hypothetical protein